MMVSHANIEGEELLVSPVHHERSSRDFQILKRALRHWRISPIAFLQFILSLT